MRPEFHNLIFRDIECSNEGGAITLDDWSPEGLLVTNCLFEGCTAPKEGVAVAIARNDAWYCFQDCVFRNNSAPSGYAVYGGRVQMDRCVFEGNQAAKNAACFGARAAGANIFNDCIFTNNVGVSGGCIVAAQSPTNVFNRCEFVDNEATGTGGVFYTRNPLTLRDCVFLRNRANDGGGAIFRYNNPLWIYNCIFEQNSTRGASNWQGGAAIFNRDDGESECVISNCVFRENFILEKNGTGGAVYGYGNRGSIVVEDTLFERNQALSNSGALKITRSATIRNCVFKENFCSNGVSAVQISTGDVSEDRPDLSNARPVILENCTFFGNTSGEMSGSRGTLWIDNTRFTWYFDQDGVQISNAANYIKANPGLPVTTNVYCALDHVTVRHCTFVNNASGANMGTLFTNNNYPTSRVDVTACVFYGNTNPNGVRDIYGKVQTLTYSSLESPENSVTLTDAAQSGNNWFAGTLGNPRFDETMGANGSEKPFLDGSVLPTLAFAPGSPLRNRAPVTVAEDARGLPRGTLSALADLGAYEFQPFTPTVILVQ